MNRVAAFARLDFYTLKPYRKSLVVFFGLAIVMTIGFHSLSTLCFYLMIGLIMIGVYPFSIGEVNKLNVLYGALPLRRKNIVMGRYAFAVFMEIGTILLALLLSFVFSLFTSMKFVLWELLLYLCIASLLYSVIAAVQYPIYFHLGYTKAKFLVYVPLVIVFLGVMILQNAKSIEFSFEAFEVQMASNPLPVCVALVLVGHLLLALSCLIAHNLYGKKDL